MKKANQIFLILFLSAMILGGIWIAWSANKSYLVPENYKAVDLPKDYKAKFEEKIAELLGLATNDYTLGFGGPFKIDMATRKKYFTPEAWEQYQAYEREHKFFLRSLGSNSVFGSPDWDQQGQDNLYFKGSDDDAAFQAKGRFYYMKEGDLAMGHRNTFEFFVSYEQQSSDPQDFIINKWHIKMHKIKRAKPW